MYRLDELIEVMKFKESLGLNPLGPNCHATYPDRALEEIKVYNHPKEPCVTIQIPQED